MKITVYPEKTNQKTILTLLEELGYSLPCNCHGSHACNGAVYTFDCSLVPKEPVTVSLPDRNAISHGIALEEKVCTPGKGNCLLIDLGTTTVALAFIDTVTKELRQTTVFANPQRKYGSDVISRIKSSTHGNKALLKDIICQALRQETETLCQKNNQTPADIKHCYIGGNTTMIHLLFGYDCEPLSHSPFQVNEVSPEPFFYGSCQITIFPWISAFVGGDIMAGLYACPITAISPSLFLDLGTNGEMLLSYQHTLYAASTAAGPAFEGNGLSCGCPAIPGAISAVKLRRLRPAITTIENKLPVGICGSGAISILAELLTQEYITTQGILTDKFPKEGLFLGTTKEGKTLRFTAEDVRCIQLAIAAIGAGIDTLCHTAGCSSHEITRLYLGGGFGFSLDLPSCQKLGLFSHIDTAAIIPMGNTCLRGLEQYACQKKPILNIPDTVSVSLADNDYFQSRFLRHMTYDDFLMTL